MNRAGCRHRVVIDDDDLDAVRRAREDRLEIARAAVASDDELARACREVGRRFGREAIARVAARDGRLDVRTRRAQERRQQRRGRHAIDVVVSEHADPLAARDGIGDPTDRGRHPGETCGWAQRGEPRIDEALRFARLGHAACDEAPRSRGPNPQRLRQSADQPIVERTQTHLHPRTLVLRSDTRHRQRREIPTDPRDHSACVWR